MMMIGKVFCKATSRSQHKTVAFFKSKSQDTAHRREAKVQTCTRWLHSKVRKTWPPLPHPNPQPALNILQDHIAGPEKTYALKRKGRMESLSKIIQLQLNKSMINRVVGQTASSKLLAHFSRIPF